MPLVEYEKTVSLLKKYGIKPKKGLGQNFLINPSVLEHIIETAAIQPDNLVVEVGPGLGTLTELLADHASRVVAIEIDDKMVAILHDTLGSRENVTILQQDFLQADIAQIVQEFKPGPQSGYQIVANLPYYISTPIIQRIVENRDQLISAVIMLQKEVAERIAAEPGGKEYGSLTVAVQYYMRAEITKIVGKDSFIPAPNVESAILKLTPHTINSCQVIDESFFFEIVYGAFRQRRKTLLNNLRQMDILAQMNAERIQEALVRAEIDGKRRGETLSIGEFAELANSLYCLLNQESR